MFQIKCYIFDLDGTLLHTKKANIESYKQAFADLNLEFEELIYNQHYGLRFDDLAKKIKPDLTSDQVQSLKELKSKYYKTNFSLVEPNSFLLNLLDHIHENTVVILATTASRKNANAILEYFEMKKYFDHIICGEDVKYAKPNPEIYLKALELSKQKAQDCLVFEDSEIGVQAAKAAGLRVIRVPNHEL